MIKQKNIVIQIILLFVTLGLYGIIWQVKASNDLVTASNGSQFKTSGIVALLLSMLTCGIYGIYWIYKMVRSASAIKGGGSDGIIYLILSFIGLPIIALIMAQSDLNRVASK